MLMTLGAPLPDEGWHIGYVDLDRGGDPEAQVSTEPSLSLAEPEVLFSRPARAMDIRFGMPDYYDVTPDGERFLVMLVGGIEGEGQTTVVVMGDWRAAVERQ